MPADQYLGVFAMPARRFADRTYRAWRSMTLKPDSSWVGWSPIIPVIRPLQHAAYLVAGLIPRNRRLWVFGSWSGLRFADNAAALFHYSANHAGADLTCVWITRDRAIRDDLRRQGYKAHLKWSLPGLLVSLRAGVYIFDGLTKDINHWSSLGAWRVLLRHGVGIKKIERAIDQPGHRLYRLFHGSWWQRLAWSFLIPWHCVRPDLVLASSQAHAEQAERFFGVPASAVAVTGMPRNDALLSPAVQRPIPDALANWIDCARSDNRSIALYLPTFRDDGAPTFPYDWADFDAMLAATNVGVIVKPHPADTSLSLKRIANLSHITTARAAIDPGELLPVVDCLVTDYSSVAYDFMLFRKPLIFFCPDLDAYQRQSRSFDVPYERVTPGRHAHSLEELTEALVAATGDGDDTLGCTATHYDRVLARFQAFGDDGSCRRAHREILSRFVTSDVRAGATRSETSPQ